MTGLYLAAFFSLNKIVASLLGDCNADVRDGNS